VLPERKIRKAKRPSQRSANAADPASDAPKTNPFATVQLVAPPSSEPGNSSLISGGGDVAASRVVCAESEAGAAQKTGAAASSAGGVLEGETPVETRWTYWDATPPLSEKPPAAGLAAAGSLPKLEVCTDSPLADAQKLHGAAAGDADPSAAPRRTPPQTHATCTADASTDVSRA
jgi:hypothetical protein